MSYVSETISTERLPLPPRLINKKKMHLLNFWDVYSSGMFNWENSNLDLIEEF